MKKFLAILLAALMIFGVTACSSSQEPAAEPEAAEGTETETEGEAAQEQLTIAPGKLSVALSPDFAPMEFVDTSKSGQDQYVGFDVTLAKFIAEEMGCELTIEPMSFDACQAAVQTHSVDMSISGKWTKAEDYSGLKVGAQSASLQYNLCTAQLPSDTEIVLYADLGTAVEALRSGIVDAVAVAYGNGEAIISNNDAIAMSGFEFEVSEEAENNVIMMTKGNDALLEKVNEILAKAYDAGYYGQWYEEAKALAGIDTAEEVSY